MVEASSGQFTGRAENVFSIAFREAQTLGCKYAGPEHVLLAIARAGDNPGAEILLAAGLDHGELRRQVIKKVQEKKRAEEEEAAKKRNAPDFDLQHLLPLITTVGTAVFEHLADKLRKLG